jgi:hypothetical protein
MLGDISKGKLFHLPIYVLHLGDASDTTLFLHLLRTLLLAVDRLLAHHLYLLSVLYHTYHVLLEDGVVVVGLSLLLYCLVMVDYLFDPGFLMENLTEVILIHRILCCF